MNRKLKEKWIKALRSGAYAQGKNFLCQFDDDGEAKYCCLGVLFEVVNGENAWRVNEYDVQVLIATDDSRFTEDTWYNGDLFSIQDMEMLAKLNDNGRSFAYIADWIERNIQADD